MAAPVRAASAAVTRIGTRIDLDGVSRRYRMGEATVTAIDGVDLHSTCRPPFGSSNRDERPWLFPSPGRTVVV